MALWDEFRAGMRELGYVEGRDLVYESRWAEGKVADLPRLARELAGLEVEVIFVSGTPAALAAQRAASPLPIVTASSADPVGAGLARSLARPGGNVTGMSTMSPGLSGKWLQVLKEIVPAASRAAVVYNGANPTGLHIVKGMEPAARSFGIELAPLEVRTPADLERLLERAGNAQAIIVIPDPMLYAQRRRVIELCRRERIVSIAEWKEFAHDGGLIAYGVSLADMFRRAATHVHRILLGAKPAELPFEQASRFELVINLGTARALRLAIPQALLLRADGVVE